MLNEYILKVIKSSENMSRYSVMKENKSLNDGNVADYCLEDVIKRLRMAGLSIKGSSVTLSDGTSLAIKDIVNPSDLLKISTDTFANIIKNNFNKVSYMCNDERWVEEFAKRQGMTDFIDTLSKNMSIYGGVYTKSYLVDGKAEIKIVDSSNVIVIPNKYDIEKVDGYVTVSPFSSTGEELDYAVVQYYGEGIVTSHIFTYSLGELGAEVEKSTFPSINTEDIELSQFGVNENLINQALNIKDCNSVYGQSDYNKAVKNTLKELVVLKTLLGASMSKYVFPILTTNFEPEEYYDEFNDVNISTQFQGATAYKEDKAPDIKYVQFDCDYNSHFEMIGITEKNLMESLGISDAILGRAEKGGNALSGTALELQMVNTRAKTESKFTSLVELMQTAINTAYKLETGKDLELIIKHEFEFFKDSAYEQDVITKKLANLKALKELGLLESAELDISKILADIVE